MASSTKFHLISGTPPSQYFDDMKGCNKFSQEQLEQLLGLCFGFLGDPTKGSRLVEQLPEFSAQHSLTSSVTEALAKSFIALISAALKKSLSSEQLQDDLQNLGLGEEHAALVSTQFGAQQANLQRGGIGQTHMVNQLVDLDWTFGVTAASSELNKVGNTFLQLKLVVNKGNTTDNVYMELSLPQFYSFLHEMERAKASMDFFS